MAREIHLLCEAKSHPLTFHQKLQPNYISCVPKKPLGVLNGLPTTQQLLIDEQRPEDWDEHDDDEMEDSETERAYAEELEKQNASRDGKQIKRAKLTKTSRHHMSTNNEARNQRVTRSMEKAKARGEGAGASRRRRSDPGGTKRKLIDDDEEGGAQSRGGELADGKTDENASFDLFSFGEDKKDWDEHPKMENLMELGRKKMEGVGFSSPREGMGNVTIQKLAKSHKVKLPKKRKPSVDVLVRALAIEKLMAEDPTTSKYYEDKKTKAKWLLLSIHHLVK